MQFLARLSDNVESEQRIAAVVKIELEKYCSYKSDFNAVFLARPTSSEEMSEI